MYKWQLPEAGDEVGQGRIAREHRASIKSVKRAVDVLGRIDKAGGMAKQVAHGHRPLLLRQDELRPPGRRIGDFGRDLHAREFRQVSGDCGVKLDLPILDDGHRGNAGDWFGHRRDPENCVRPHRNCSAAILKAYCLQVRELNVPGDRHHSARQITGFNVFLIQGSDPCQSFGRKA
jgi:hypothetical protein